MAKDKLRDSLESPGHSKIHSNKKSILLVDDYKSIRELIKSKLQSIGMTVTEAGNGFEAIKLLRSRSFDMVFTDLVMPEMDGFELCEEIRRSPEIQHIPVVVVSTHCETAYIFRALQCGADDYISKPIDLEILKKVISRVGIATLREV